MRRPSDANWRAGRSWILRLGSLALATALWPPSVHLLFAPRDGPDTPPVSSRPTPGA